MDIQLIVLIIGFGTLLVERIARWMMHIKRSKCCCSYCELEEVKKNDDIE